MKNTYFVSKVHPKEEGGGGRKKKMRRKGEEKGGGNRRREEEEVAPAGLWVGFLRVGYRPAFPSEGLLRFCTTFLPWPGRQPGLSGDGQLGSRLVSLGRVTRWPGIIVSKKGALCLSYSGRAAQGEQSRSCRGRGAP